MAKLCTYSIVVVTLISIANGVSIKTNLQSHLQFHALAEVEDRTE